MKEQATRVLQLMVKFWGLILFVLLAIITIKIVGAGGVDQYLKKTWSVLEVYVLVCLFVAECILLVVWFCLSRKKEKIQWREIPCLKIGADSIGMRA